MQNIYENPYELDLDENGLLALTQKNAEFIYAIIQIDSSYRKTFDSKIDKSAYGYVVKNYKAILNYKDNYNIIEEVCKRIDKESSTHIYTTGNDYKGEKNGLQLTAEGIKNIDGLLDRLSGGDSELVCEIAGFTGMNKFSFASKFCAYMCRFLFEDKIQRDNYVVYDDVLAKTLPYYEKYFLGTITHKTREGADSVRTKFMVDKNYEGYRNYVDSIRNGVQEKYECDLTREELDYMIWYYYKGGNWKEVWRFIP